MGVPEKYLKEEAERQAKEIKSRMERYRGKRPNPGLKGKDIIIVDDGIATGNTILAAIESVRKNNPSSIILAIGVAPPETIKKLSKSVDQIVCLDTPEPFFAIGDFYESFEQVGDDEVKRILNEIDSSDRAAKRETASGN